MTTPTPKKQPRKALSNKCGPRGLGLQFLAVVWLLLDRLQPSEMVQGVIWTLVAILMAIKAWDFFTAEDVELEDLLK